LKKLQQGNSTDSGVSHTTKKLPKTEPTDLSSRNNIDRQYSSNTDTAEMLEKEKSTPRQRADSTVTSQQESYMTPTRKIETSTNPESRLKNPQNTNQQKSPKAHPGIYLMSSPYSEHRSPKL
jgi:hypothetical protein